MIGQLPDSRRAVNGRTHSTPWSAASMDPISHWKRQPSWHKPAGLVLAISIGLAVAVLLVVELSK